MPAMPRPRAMRRRGRRALLSCLLALTLAGCSSGGFIFGDPTGLSASWPLGGRKNVVLGLGLGFLEWGVARGHVDWIAHASRVRGGEWVPYWGLGVRFVAWGSGSNDEVDVGPRLPLGLTYDFGRMRPYLFAEVAPGVELTEGGMTVDWGLGLRFAF